MVKYKPVEFDVFPLKVLVGNIVSSLYNKLSQLIIDKKWGLVAIILSVDTKLQ